MARTRGEWVVGSRRWALGVRQAATGSEDRKRAEAKETPASRKQTGAGTVRDLMRASRRYRSSAEQAEEALGRLGGHLRLGLATVLCFDPDREVFVHTHEWSQQGLFEGASFRGTGVREPHDWLARSLAAGSEILINRFEDLPVLLFGSRFAV